MGNPLHRFTVVNAHYGTSASIARAGLNINPLTLPFSIFGIVATVASIVYLVDVRPAVKEIQGGGSRW